MRRLPLLLFLLPLDSEVALMVYGPESSAMQKRCKLTRCVYKVKVIRRGSRGSLSTVARLRVKPSWSSMSLSRTTPASEDSRPPSKSSSTALPPTGIRRSGGGGLGDVLSAGIESKPEIVSTSCEVRGG